MKKCIFLITLLFGGLCTYANADNYTFNFDLSDFQIERAQSGAIIIPLRDDFIMLEDTTLPALPVYYANILLPPNTTVSNCNYSVLKQNFIADISYVRNNLPVVSVANNILKKTTNYPSLTYKESGLYPTQQVSILSEEEVGNYRYVIIQICPFKYFIDSCLYFLSQIQLSIEVTPKQNHSTNEMSNINKKNNIK